MHLAIELQRLDDLGTEDLQRTAIVVQLDARGPRDEPIGEHRRQPAIDERILAVLAPAAHDVAFVLPMPFFTELPTPPSRRATIAGEIARVVLKIAVGGGNQPAASERNAVQRLRSVRSCAGTESHEAVDRPPEAA